MSDVFVSYAREDSDVVARIAQALRSSGKSVWIDEEGIESADRWRKALEEAIDAADAVVVVLSHHWVESGPCRDELAHAAEAHKRLVPVVVEDAPRADMGAALGPVPEELAELDWVFLGPNDDLDAAADEVVRAVDLDLDLLRLHSAVLMRARAWEAAGRRPSPLLRGEELRRAEAWRDRAAIGTKPAPTDLQSAFIAESRRRASKRTRQVLIASLSVATVATVLAAVALVERAHAVEQSHISQSRALAATADADLTSDPEMSISLAVQAVHVERTPQAVHALSEALDASRLRLDLRQPAGVTAVAFSHDGAELATGDATGTVRVWRLAGPTVAWTRHVAGASAVTSLAFSPNGADVAVTTSQSARAGCRAEVLNAASGVPVRALVSGAQCTAWVGYLGATGKVAVGSANTGGSSVSLFGATGAATSRVTGLPNGFGFAFSADGREAAFVGLDHYVYVVSIPSGQVVARVQSPVPIFNPESVAFGPTSAGTSPDYQLLIGTEYETEIYDIRSRTHFYLPSVGASNAVSFDPDGRLAVAATSGGVVVWSASGRIVETLHGPTSELEQATAFSPSGMLATGSADGSVRVWAPDPDLPSLALPAPVGDPVDYGGNAVGTGLVAVGDASGALLVTNESGQVREELDLGGDPPFAVGADGALVYLRGDLLLSVHLPSTRTVRSWELPFSLLGWPSLAVSGDGSLAATFEQVSETTCQLTVYSSTGTHSVKVPVPSYSYCSEVALSPNGRYVVIVGAGGTDSVRVLSVGDLRPVFSAQGTSAAFSDDGSTLAVEQPDESIALLDVGSWRTTALLLGEDYGDANLVFSPTGDLVSALDEDYVLRTWDVADGTLLSTVHVIDGEFPGRSAWPEPALTSTGLAIVGNDSTAAFDTFEVCDACLDPAALLRQAAQRLREISPVHAP